MGLVLERVWLFYLLGASYFGNLGSFNAMYGRGTTLHEKYLILFWEGVA